MAVNSIFSYRKRWIFLIGHSEIILNLVIMNKSINISRFSLIYDMPKVVFEAGVVDYVLTIDNIAIKALKLS